MVANEKFYEQLSIIRELFHKYGKFDDANAKLDEISKYIAIYIYFLKKERVESNEIKGMLQNYSSNNSYKLVENLKLVFDKITVENEFINSDGTSIFGNLPVLNIDANDNEFCYLLLKLVVDAVDSIIDNREGSRNFDILNESFGHFVRDNFRSHIEDAQYMTPNEVVELICEIALNDLSQQGNLIFDDIIVCDPSSGVGSFLSAFSNVNKKNNIIDNNKITYLGQDKVARMVRFSKINMLLSDSKNSIITEGNSLVGNSLLDNYLGKIDIILTNPPFGAKFSSYELKENCRNNYPYLHDLILKNGNNFNSEILFVDRYMSLLKSNGKVLAVLPDSVISSTGLNEILRHRLINNRNIKIKAIIELPAVTFAQAGTRTKTSILYIEKSKSEEEEFTFIAKSEDLGFQVSNKKGATIKSDIGKNDLKEIAITYKNFANLKYSKEINVVNENPSCVMVKTKLLKNNSWTPNHYNANKFKSIEIIHNNNVDIEQVKLIDIVTFDTNQRKKEFIQKESKCISVLHVIEDNLSFEELLAYNPKYQGIVCKSGDLLFSKINPRIPRIFIVPNLEFPTTCSTEFEIINSKIELNNYAIKLLLLLPSVQNQILSLTSGTSSSHNRIRSNNLASILIPLPKESSEKYNNLITSSQQYLQNNQQINQLRYDVFKIKNSIVNSIV